MDRDREDFGLKVAPLALELVAPQDGWLQAVNCRQVGLSLADLGGARRQVEDPLDLTAGIPSHPAIGDKLSKGDPLATIHSSNKEQAQTAAKRILSALQFYAEPTPPRDLILDRYS